MDKRKLYENVMKMVSTQIKNAMNESLEDDGWEDIILDENAYWDEPIDSALDDMYKIPRVGDRIRIIRLADELDDRYSGREGVIRHIDDIGQLHGTWGGLAVIPEVDEYEIIG